MVYLQNKIFQASFQFANHNDKTNVFDPFTETTERLYILLGQLALKKRKILLIYIQWKSVRQIMKRLNSLRQQIKGRKRYGN